MSQPPRNSMVIADLLNDGPSERIFAVSPESALNDAASRRTTMAADLRPQQALVSVSPEQRSPHVEVSRLGNTEHNMMYHHHHISVPSIVARRALPSDQGPSDFVEQNKGRSKRRRLSRNTEPGSGAPSIVGHLMDLSPMPPPPVPSTEASASESGHSSMPETLAAPSGKSVVKPSLDAARSGLTPTDATTSSSEPLATSPIGITNPTSNILSSGEEPRFPAQEIRQWWDDSTGHEPDDVPEVFILNILQMLVKEGLLKTLRLVQPAHYG